MKSSKKYLSVLLILILVLSVVSFAAGVKEQVQALIRPDLNIILNGEKLTMTDVNGDTVHPLTYNGTTYLPARAISENLDLEVNWDAETQTVSLEALERFQGEEYSISFTREAIDGGYRFTADVPENQAYIYEWRFLSGDELLATFDKHSVPIDFKNEGVYTIKLNIQNSKGQWSKTYTEEFYYQKDLTIE